MNQNEQSVNKSIKRVIKKKNSKSSLSESENKSKEDKIDCKFCDLKFSRQGLGGHMSRVHPGKSNQYKQKRNKRDQREDIRRLLRLSQNVYRQRYNEDDIKNIEMNRNKLNSIRKEIIEFENKYEVPFNISHISML